MSIGVLLVEDQPLVRAGIAMLLASDPDIAVLAEAGDGREAVELAAVHRPDVVVMDVRMPGVDGIEATRRLSGDVLGDPDRLVKVLVLTTFGDDDAVHGALRAGASGFLLKHAAPRDLLAAIREVAAGRAWIDPAVGRHVIDALVVSSASVPDEDFGRQLTPRECEVLALVALGLSNTDIVERLVLSEATVKTHVSRILLKTGSRDRAHLVARAHLSGFVRQRSQLRGAGRSAPQVSWAVDRSVQEPPRHD